MARARLMPLQMAKEVFDQDAINQVEGSNPYQEDGIHLKRDIFGQLQQHPGDAISRPCTSKSN